MPDSLFGSSAPDGTGAPTNIPINPVMPPYMKNMNAAVMPNMPNQLPQLARDMADGGFVPKTAAGHKAAIQYLTSIYKPAQTYNIAPPATVKRTVKPVVKPVTKPVTPPVTPAGPSGWNYGGGRNSR